MFSKYHKKKALELYAQYKSVTKVIQCLGYPTRQALYNWIAESKALPKRKASRKRWNNTPDQPMHPPIEVKLDAIRRCFEQGENVQ